MARRINKAFAVPFAVIGGVVAVWATILSVFLTFAAYVFQFNVYHLVGKNIPWYLDLLGALIFSFANFPLAVLILIARACGYDTPFFPLP